MELQGNVTLPSMEFFHSGADMDGLFAKIPNINKEPHSKVVDRIMKLFKESPDGVLVVDNFDMVLTRSVVKGKQADNVTRPMVEAYLSVASDTFKYQRPSKKT